MFDDTFYMRRCNELARKAAGRTSPNPLVGSVVVSDDGAIIAEGFHSKAGQAHAEVEALNKAGSAAAGMTLYVNLEPCCHQGRTGPCSERVIASGVKRVVCGMPDPNPKVAGGGIGALKAAGIEVHCGIVEDECRYLNRSFIKWIQKKTPWLALKMACTLDGRIADRHGKSRWITGQEARSFVHELRNEFDGVMIGSNTAIADDPELTVRGIDQSRNPTRVVVDSQLKISPNLQMCRNPDGKTVVLTQQPAIEKESASFPSTLQLLAVPELGASHHLNLEAALRKLGDLELLSILCEGGAGLSAALLEHKLVDEIYWFIAPKLLIDGQATPVLNGSSAAHLDEVTKLSNNSFQKLGDDLLIHGLLTTP